MVVPAYGNGSKLNVRQSGTRKGYLKSINRYASRWSAVAGSNPTKSTLDRLTPKLRLSSKNGIKGSTIQKFWSIFPSRAPWQTVLIWRKTDFQGHATRSLPRLHIPGKLTNRYKYEAKYHRSNFRKIIEWTKRNEVIGQARQRYDRAWHKPVQWEEMTIPASTLGV